MAMVPMLESTASPLKLDNKKYEEIFNGLLPKLLNKKKEKSKEFPKLVAYLNNTVEHHLLKHTQMSLTEREEFFVFAFLTL